jgi:hypothetical protein
MSRDIRIWSTLLPVTIAALVLSAPPAALGQDKLLRVDWQSQEIKDFVASRATTPLLSVGPEQEAKLSRLKLPVLGFDRPPSLVTNSLAAGERPTPERSIVMDENEPIWYHITDRYGDLAITVEADLRVQQEFPANFPVYGQAGQGAAASEPTISVFDDKSEVGMEGAIADYTVYKFPDVPYRVTIECSKRTKETCRDIATIAKDRDLLKLLSARPPQ